MPRNLISLLLVTLLCIQPLCAAFGQAQQFVVVKDLKSAWMPDNGREGKVVYFSVDREKNKGRSLRIGNKKSFSVFVNNKMVGSYSAGVVMLDLDSLARRYTSPLRIGVYCEGRQWLITEVGIKASVTQAPVQLERKSQYFLDFSILGAFILLIYFVALLSTNGRLTLDYLNFIKLFSIQERDENILTSRVTASVNLLFYAFASFLGAFLLLVIFHFAPGDFPLAHLFQPDSVGQAFVQWGRLALAIFGVLMAKLLIIYFFSLLFGIADFAPIQFFSYLRLFLFTFGLTGFVALIFFAVKTQSPQLYASLLKMSAALFFLWVAVLFLKLMARAPFRVFHLFSYLCASELIPFVILIKVVFF